MKKYDNCELSDLEALVYQDIVNAGYDPQNQDDVKKYWATRLDGE